MNKYVRVVIFDEENGHYPANIPFPISIEMDNIIFYKEGFPDKFYVDFIDEEGEVSDYTIEVVGPLWDKKSINEEFDNLNMFLELAVTWKEYRDDWDNEFMWYERFKISYLKVPDNFSEEDFRYNLMIKAGEALRVLKGK